MNKLMFCMIAGIMSLIGCGTPEPTIAVRWQVIFMKEG